VNENQTPEGLNLFKKAFKQQIMGNNGIGDYIDDRSSIYEADYKSNMKIENKAMRKLKF
jgi:hypothetical protein